MLECADADLFDWITGRAAPPPEHDHDVTRLLLAFSTPARHDVSDSATLARSLAERPRAVTLYGAPEGHDAAAIGDVVAEGQRPRPGCMSAATTAGWRGLPRRSPSSIPSSTC